MAPLPFPSLTGDEEGSRSSQLTSKVSQQIVANKLVNQESTTCFMPCKPASSTGLLFPKPTSGLMSTATTPSLNSIPAASSVSSLFQAKTGANGSTEVKKGAKPATADAAKQENG